MLLKRKLQNVLMINSSVFVGLLLIGSISLAQGGAWIKLADIPTPRCFLSGCTLDGKIYVIGGTESISSTGPSVGTMEVYNPTSDSWDTKAEMPTSRVEFAACAVNGKIYAIGGVTNHGASPIGTVEEYDPLTNSWDINKTPMPTPRYGAAYGVIDNKIYVAGGATGSNFIISDILEIYDPVTDTWDSTNTTMLSAIYQPQGAIINNMFYVIGGLVGPPPLAGTKDSSTV
ncbi:Kelch repeat-containing protein [Bacteroidota bacterium]